jgi:hypothetical protein
LNAVGLRQQRLRNRLAGHAASDIRAPYGCADQRATRQGNDQRARITGARLKSNRQRFLVLFGEGLSPPTARLDEVFT